MQSNYDKIWESTLKTPAFIQSGNQLMAIDLYDRLNLEVINERKINIRKTKGYKIPTNDQNPVYQIATALQKLKPNKLGVNITIQKNIPTMSGLNSQLSNAAGALIALNKLWKFNLKEQELIRIAKTVDPKLAKIIKKFLKPSKTSQNVILARPKHIVIDKNWAKDKNKTDICQHFPDLRAIIRQFKVLKANPVKLSEKGSVVFGVLKEPVDKKMLKKSLRDKLDFLWMGKTC